MPAKSPKLDRTSVFSDILGDLGAPDSPDTSKIELGLIDPDPAQPRRYHDPAGHESLVGSVRSHGVLQPILVRRLGERYRIVAGERRWRAAKEAGFDEIPAIVLEVGELQALEIATLENLAREDLNPVEETEAVLRLLERKLDSPRERVVSLLRQLDNEARGRSANSGIGNSDRAAIESVFKAVGRFTAQSFVVNRLPLLKLPADLLEAIVSGRLPFSSAKLIAAVKDEPERRRLIDEAATKKLSKGDVAARVQATLKGDKATPSPASSLGIEGRLGRVSRLVREAKRDKLERVARLLTEIETILAD